MLVVFLLVYGLCCVLACLCAMCFSWLCLWFVFVCVCVLSVKVFVNLMCGLFCDGG